MLSYITVSTLASDVTASGRHKNLKGIFLRVLGVAAAVVSFGPPMNELVMTKQVFSTAAEVPAVGTLVVTLSFTRATMMILLLFLLLAGNVENDEPWF